VTLNRAPNTDRTVKYTRLRWIGHADSMGREGMNTEIWWVIAWKTTTYRGDKMINMTGRL